MKYLFALVLLVAGAQSLNANTTTSPPLVPAPHPGQDSYSEVYYV